MSRTGSFVRAQVVGAVALGLVLTSNVPAGSLEPSAARPRHIAVFDDQFPDSALPLIDVLNADPRFDAQLVLRDQVEAGILGHFDCVIVRVQGPQDLNLPTAATVEALRRYVASGGGYVSDWWGSGAAFAQHVPSIDDDYYTPARFIGLFGGGASDGDLVGYDTPITIVQRHPVVAGLPPVFSGAGGTEYFVRPVPRDPRLSVIATYDGHGGTNPAILVGPTGSSSAGVSYAVLLSFDAIDDPSQVYLQRLWLNSAAFACQLQPR